MPIYPLDPKLQDRYGDYVTNPRGTGAEAGHKLEDNLRDPFGLTPPPGAPDPAQHVYYLSGLNDDIHEDCEALLVHLEEELEKITEQTNRRAQGSPDSMLGQKSDPTIKDLGKALDARKDAFINGILDRQRRAVEAARQDLQDNFGMTAADARDYANTHLNKLTREQVEAEYKKFSDQLKQNWSNSVSPDLYKNFCGKVHKQTSENATMSLQHFDENGDASMIKPPLNGRWKSTDKSAQLDFAGNKTTVQFSGFWHNLGKICSFRLPGGIELKTGSVKQTARELLITHLNNMRAQGKHVGMIRVEHKNMSRNIQDRMNAELFKLCQQMDPPIKMVFHDVRNKPHSWQTRRVPYAGHGEDERDMGWIDYSTTKKGKKILAKLQKEGDLHSVKQRDAKSFFKRPDEPTPRRAGVRGGAPVPPGVGVHGGTPGMRGPGVTGGAT